MSTIRLFVYVLSYNSPTDKLINVKDTESVPIHLQLWSDTYFTSKVSSYFIKEFLTYTLKGYL